MTTRTLVAAVVLILGAGLAIARPVEGQSEATDQRAEQPDPAEGAGQPGASQPGQESEALRRELREKANEILFADIELTKDQQAKIQEIQERHYAQGVADGRRIRNLRAEMATAREEGDSERAEEIAQQIEKLKQARRNREEMHAEMREVLNEQQREQFDRNLAKLKAVGATARAKRWKAEAQRQREDALTDIELTEDQEQQMSEIRKRYEARRADHRQEIRDLRAKLTAARQEGDSEEVEEIYRQIIKLNKARPNREEMLAEMREVLNEQQREQFDRNRAPR